ncbi:MAG: amidase [Acidobacteria bacterium]|nr:amidase [Acidobacteriota bacterium]
MTMPEYDTLDATGLAELVRTRQVSPADLLGCAIERIEARDGNLNAVVIRAFDQARAALTKGLPEGPFTGVPFLVKNADPFFCEGVPLTQGNRALADYVSDHDSLLVARYKKAGLVPLGATNTPEFSLSAVTEPELYGPTENPWRPGITCGGSSGGSAVAVATRMVPMAGGSDIAGSIRIPAGCCGVFGFKPTHGRTPLGEPPGGDVEFLCAHAITRSVRDSAALLDATCGAFESALPGPPAPIRPFAEEAATPPGPLRIAFATSPPLPGDVHPECIAAVHDAARLLSGLGHRVEEVVLPVKPLEFARDWLIANGAITSAFFRQLPRYAQRTITWDDLEPSTAVMKLFSDQCRGDLVNQAFSGIRALGATMSGFFRKFDVLLTPTLSRPPVPHASFKPRGAAALATRVLASGRLGCLVKPPRSIHRIVSDAQFRFYPFTPLGSALGLPSANIPLCWNDQHLPIGTLFTAAYGMDGLLFRLSAQLEAARPWANRVPPALKGHP